MQVKSVSIGHPLLSRGGELVLLAPAAAVVPARFRDVSVDPSRHAAILHSLRRLRGRAYVRDGAISAAQLTGDGQHVQVVDDASWHVISCRPDGEAIACARFRVHDEDVSPEALGVWSSALARSSTWSGPFRAALEEELTLARGRNLAYAEVGGWAVAEEWRRTAQAATTALSTYALAENFGGCIGITMATVRHCSSRILRKLGGRSLEREGRPIPPYFDPQFGCEMEILRFDSSAPGRRYGWHVAQLAERLQNIQVVCRRHVACLGDMQPALN